MKIESKNFSDTEFIPQRFSCEGEDINPELKISGIPEKTKALALIVDDPDAPSGIFNHWILWNIPVKEREKIIEENSVPGLRGMNGFGKLDYGGPCPPSGTHRYYFRVYALKEKLDLGEGNSRQELKKAMQEKIIEQSELMGKYQKKNNKIK